LVPSVICALGLKNKITASLPAAAGSNGDWTLTWHDEFDGPNGAPPDPLKWEIETGGNGWGNEELEYYTARRQNIRQEDGHLILEALQEKYVGPDGVQRDFTSGRLMSAGHFSQRYGRFEARIKIPSGRGAWPAFWLLGDDFSTSGWPRCGEIDIMEGNGLSDSEIQGSAHGPGYSGARALTASYPLPAGRLSDHFHVYALEWEPNVLRFYVDGLLYATKTPADLPPGAAWVFDHPFHLILNVALRGDYPRAEDHSTVFPMRMLVDYVRVYRLK
jgi:beta-glucanase (GH16 family)